MSSFHHNRNRSRAEFPYNYVNDEDNDNDEKEEEKKGDEYNDDRRSGSRTDLLSTPTRIIRSSRSHISSRWMSIQEFYNATDLQTQRQQTRLFINLLKDIFQELSPQTQICIMLLSIGSC